MIKALMTLGLSLADTKQFAMIALILLWSWRKQDASLAEFGHILLTAENDAFRYDRYTLLLIWDLEGLWEVLGSHIHFQDLLNGFRWSFTNPLVPLGMLSQNLVGPETFRNGLLSFESNLQAFAIQYFHTFLNSLAAMEGWRLLARKIFVGATASEASSMNIMEILTSLWRRQFPLQPFEIWVRRALGMLLEDLAIAGIDLEEYMRLEAIRSYDCGYEGQSIGYGLELRPEMRIPESGPALVIHAIGSMPSDWAFSWDPCIEELSGQFWSMMSHTKRPIPGAWVDFDPYSEQVLKDDGCHMEQFSCTVTRRIGGNKLKEKKLLRVRGMTTCQETFPVFSPDIWL
jgi:hypothetical protein